MSFNKKYNTPDPEKNGIYHDVSAKLNGISNQDRNEEVSLGNWNSLVYNNNVFVNPKVESISDTTDNSIYLVPPYKPPRVDEQFYIENWYSRRETSNNDTPPTLSDYNNDYSENGGNLVGEGLVGSKFYYRFYCDCYTYSRDGFSNSREDQSHFENVPGGYTNLRVMNRGGGEGPSVPYIWTVDDLFIGTSISGFIGFGWETGNNPIYIDSTNHNNIARGIETWMNDKSQALYDFASTRPMIIEPILNSPTYGNLTEGNPMKGFYSEEHQAELDGIVNEEYGADGSVKCWLEYSTGGGTSYIPAFMVFKLLYDRVKVNRFGDEIPLNRYIDPRPSPGVFESNKPDPYRGHLLGKPDQFFRNGDGDIGEAYYNRTLKPTYWTFYALQPQDAYNTYMADEGFELIEEDGEPVLNNAVGDDGDWADEREQMVAVNSPIVDWQFPLMILDDRGEDGKYNLYGVNLRQYENSTNQEWKYSNSDTQYEQGYSSEGEDYDARISYLVENFNYPSFEMVETDLSMDFSELVSAAYASGSVSLSSISKPDFEVICFSKPDAEDDYSTIDLSVAKNQYDVNYFLYYNKDSQAERYSESSFPVKLYLTLNLYNESFDYHPPLNSDTIKTYEILENLTQNVQFMIYNSLSTKECIYRYHVIQWGDEEKLLTNEQIEDSFYFKPYQSDTNEIVTETYDWKMASRKQIISSKNTIDSTGKYSTFSHVYKEPGVKNIKIIVYRYSKDDFLLVQTTLVEKNVVINDGFINSQDFEVFGGSEYNFLPAKENQMVIGGLDENSKYIQSSKKIQNEDLYDRDSFVSKAVTDKFLDGYRDGLFGKNPGKLDLGTVRAFSGVKDLSSMTGSFHINNNSKDNTLISNIFIDDIDNEFKTDSIVELNPQKKDFDTIENTVGNKNIAILIGDYELEKKDESSPIRKKGYMNKPQLDNNSKKQAI